MRRPIQTLGILMLGAASAFACSRQTPGNQAAMADSGQESAGGNAMLNDTMQQGGAPGAVTLAAKNNSGITGTANLTRSGDSTTIVVTLNGAKAGTSYPSHVHVGHCDQPGSVVVPLQNVQAGDNGSGTSTTKVATAKLDQARQDSGSLLVQSHQPDGTPAACGEIPAP